MAKQLSKKKPGTKKLLAKVPAKPTAEATAKIPAKASAAAKIPAKTSAVKSDDEKRLARNAALRAWRKANRDKVNEYNRAWHAAKKATTQKDGPATKTIEVDLHGGKPSDVGGEKSES